jgi:hypothetical protein
LEGADQTRRRDFIRVIGGLLTAALVIVASKTTYDYENTPVKDAFGDAMASLYLAQHSQPFCTFQGVWEDWERDETVTLGCLEVKGQYIREGSYKSQMGPRATSNVLITGTYNIDSDSCLRVTGTDQEGKHVKFTALISADKPENPTQMVSVDQSGQQHLFIWKREE